MNSDTATLTVIFGKRGSGKTTLAQRLTHDHSLIIECGSYDDLDLHLLLARLPLHNKLIVIVNKDYLDDEFNRHYPVDIIKLKTVVMGAGFNVQIVQAKEIV